MKTLVLGVEKNRKTERDIAEIFGEVDWIYFDIEGQDINRTKACIDQLCPDIIVAFGRPARQLMSKVFNVQTTIDFRDFTTAFTGNVYPIDVKVSRTVSKPEYIIIGGCHPSAKNSSARNALKYMNKAIKQQEEELYISA